MQSLKIKSSSNNCKHTKFFIYLQSCLHLHIFKMGCCNANKFDLENLKVFSHDEIVKQQIEEYPLLVYGKSSSAVLQQIKDVFHKHDI